MMAREDFDPTSAGFAPPRAGAARLSLNEAESLCLKAARGAGMGWGLAEEAGFAARWLYARGIDGPSALLGHLDQARGAAWEAMRPAGIGDLRPQGGGRLCPIVLGAALSDCGALPDAAFGPVAAPVLLLPFLQLLAPARGTTIAASWDGKTATVGPGGALGGEVAELAATDEALIRLAARDAAPTPSSAKGPPPKLAAETLARLDAYAMQTTVPASGASRADAGAAGDND